MQVANPQLRAPRKPAPAVRTVTVLGATGSVGTSTVDLLKRGNGKYRVEAVTAHKNAAQLAQVARDLNARFAVVADPSAYRELKDALSGSGIQAASGEAALIEAAERPADWVMAAVSGAVGLKSTLAAA
jgi:1-deoxy-D-xylulose-5-phosphate reductoisomerase